MRSSRVGIIEGHGAWVQELRQRLARHHIEVVAWDEGADCALAIVGAPDCPGEQALLAAHRIHRQQPLVPSVFLTADSSEDLAIAALREGAREYLKPPFSVADIESAVLRQLGIGGAPVDDWPDDWPQAMVGDSDSIRTARQRARQVGGTDSSVLITGETGTGKELMAAMLHQASPRAGKEFVSVNCAAIPDALLESELFGTERGAFTGAHQTRDGLLRAANGGTVFLDEIGELSTYAQAKLLRAIESRQIVRLGATRGLPLDIRIISATNRDLENLVDADRFRKDLFFRLNVVRIHLPSLRERKEDIPALCCHYIDEFNRRFRRNVTGMDDRSLQHLLRHDWPGNVRELKNVLEAVFAGGAGGVISEQDLPEDFRRRLKNVSNSSDNEKERLLEALTATEWNRTKAAEKLHWSRMTLYRKMAKHRLSGVKTERRDTGRARGATPQ